MLPMGTIITVCMLIGVLTLSASFINKQWQNLPKWLGWIMGGLVFAAGAWNTFWHGVRHLSDFWGIAALLSGVVLMLAGTCILRGTRTPAWLQKIRALVWLCLLGCFLLYANTIYRL